MTDYSQISDPVERQLCKLRDIYRAANAHNAEQVQQAIRDRFTRLRSILGRYRDKGTCIPWGILRFSAPLLENFAHEWYRRMPVSCIFHAEPGLATELCMAQLCAAILNGKDHGISSLFCIAGSEKPGGFSILPGILPTNSRIFPNADEAYPVIAQSNAPSIILIAEAGQLIRQQAWHDLLRTCVSRNCLIMIELEKDSVPALPENIHGLPLSSLHEYPGYLKQLQQAYPELLLEWKHVPATKEQLQGILRQMQLPPASSAPEPPAGAPSSAGGDAGTPETPAEQHIRPQPQPQASPHPRRRRRDIPFD